MTDQESPRERRPARSKADQRILEAARRLFLERGMAGVNMDLIAAAASVARQTLYNRFGSKEAIFQAAIEAHWSMLADPTLRLDPDETPEVVLRKVATDILDFIRERDQIAMTRMVIAESRSLPKVSEAFYRLGKAPSLQLFVDYLSQSAARGVLMLDDAELAARQFIGMVQEVLLWPQVMGQPAAPPDREQHAIDGAIGVFLAAYAPSARERE